MIGLKNTAAIAAVSLGLTTPSLAEVSSGFRVSQGTDHGNHTLRIVGQDSRNVIQIEPSGVHAEGNPASHILQLASNGLVDQNLKATPVSVSTNVLQQNVQDRERFQHAVSLLKGAGLIKPKIELEICGPDSVLRSKLGLEANAGISHVECDSPADAVFGSAGGKAYVDPQMLDTSKNSLIIVPYCVYSEKLPNSDKHRVSIFSHLSSNNQSVLVADIDLNDHKRLQKFARDFAKMAKFELSSGKLNAQLDAIPVIEPQFLVLKGLERTSDSIRDLNLTGVSLRIVPPQGFHDRVNGFQLLDSHKFERFCPIVTGEITEIILHRDVKIDSMRKGEHGEIEEINELPLARRLTDRYGNSIVSGFVPLRSAKVGDTTTHTIVIVPRNDYSKPGEVVPLAVDLSGLGFSDENPLLQYRTQPSVGQIGSVSVFSDLPAERLAPFMRRSEEIGQAIEFMNAQFHFQPGREISYIQVIGAEAPNASFSASNPQTLSFRENIFSVDTPAQVTQHEAFHLADNRLGGLSEGSFKEFHQELKNRKDGGLSFFVALNERNFRDDVAQRFGGHSQDNSAEAFASLGLSLYHSRWSEKMGTMPTEFRSDYLKALKSLEKQMENLKISPELPFRQRVQNCIEQLSAPK